MSDMGIIDEIKRYVDLRMEEARLRISGGLSRITGAMCLILIAFGILQLFFILLCIALVQILDKALGEPWGALIPCGALLAALAIILLLRKKIFRKTFDRLFTSAFGKPAADIEKETEMLGYKIDMSKEKISFKSDVVSLIAAFIKKAGKNTSKGTGKDEGKP